MIDILAMREIAKKMEATSNLANAHLRNWGPGTMPFVCKAIEEMSGAAIRDIAKAMAIEGEKQ